MSVDLASAERARVREARPDVFGRERESSRDSFEGLDAWLVSLEAVVTYEESTDANLPRATDSSTGPTR